MKILCVICNQYFIRLPTHLRKHNITLTEYESRYPDAEKWMYHHTDVTLAKMRGPRQKGVPKSEEHRKKLSIARIGKKTQPHTVSTLQKMRDAWVRRKSDVETYAKYVAALSAKCSTSEYLISLRNRISVMIATGNHNGKSSNTSLELKMKAFLERHGIQFEQQFKLSTPTGAWTFDFYLPKHNMLVETDSEYYHSKSLEVWNRDCLKERLAIEQGFTVARISDKSWNPEIIFATPTEIQAHSEWLKKHHHQIILNRQMPMSR